MPKRLLAEDFFRKTSSDRRFSSQNIFSQKIPEPNVFSQKTQKCPPPVDHLEGDISYYELVKNPTVPPKGRTFVRPLLGADWASRPCYSVPARERIITNRQPNTGHQGSSAPLPDRRGRRGGRGNLQPGLLLLLRQAPGGGLPEGV